MNNYFIDVEIKIYIDLIEYFVFDVGYFCKMFVNLFKVFGGNLVDMGCVKIIEGLFCKDNIIIEKIFYFLKNFFIIVIKVEGFYVDGFYIDYINVVYIGVYGNVLIDGLI